MLPGDRYWTYTLKNGKKRKEELYTGGSFLSQSAPFIIAGEQVASIEITNKKGEKRIVN
ncbi:MAG: hypothetical protein WKI04_11800 [Ferruginibacter sp.]